MDADRLQTVTDERQIDDRARARKSAGILSRQALRQQNLAYRGTMGVSQENRGAGFVPAYRDAVSGEAVISRFADGRPAPLHILDGLPEYWVLERDPDGRVLKTKPGVTAGFIRSGRFYTREEAANSTFHAEPPVGKAA